MEIVIKVKNIIYKMTKEEFKKYLEDFIIKQEKGLKQPPIPEIYDAEVIGRLGADIDTMSLDFAKAMYEGSFKND